MSENLLYIVPAYNEEGNIKEVIQGIKEKDPFEDSKILVVDDCSDDRTAEIAKSEGVEVVRHLTNLGGGAALRTGFQYAVEQGFDYVLCIDGDGQHNPEHIEKVAKPVTEGDADMCIGSRFKEKPGYSIPWIRLIGNKFYAGVVSLLTGTTITDCTSGYRAIGRKLFKHYAKNYPDGIWAIETTIWAGRRGFTIEEVAAPMSERDEGESHLTPIKTIKYPFAMIYAIFRAL